MGIKYCTINEWKENQQTRKKQEQKQNTQC